MLYREVAVDNQKKTLLVLPSSFVESVLKGLHNDMKHTTKDSTMSLLRERFFWPGLFSDTESWVANCERCIRRKILLPCPGLNQSPQTTKPTLYHVAIKAGLYRKATQVRIIPNIT